MAIDDRDLPPSRINGHASPAMKGRPRQLHPALAILAMVIVLALAGYALSRRGPIPPAPDHEASAAPLRQAPP